MTPERRELPRVLSVAHATSIVVGVIIGTGIFLVPQEMVLAVGSARMVYAAWIVGGLLSLCGALTYAEIAAGRPAYGGEYAFLREAYGDCVAFLHMWTWFTLAKPASLAGICAGLVRTLATFAVFGFFAMPVLGFVTWGQLAALVVLWAVTLLEILGTRHAANVQLALTWLKIALIVAIAAACLMAAGHLGSLENFATSFPGARGGFGGFMVALIAALWAYDGWSDLAPMAGEVERPQRNLPIALTGGTLAVAALYMLTNAAIQYVLPASAIAASERPAVAALQRVLSTHGLGFGAGLVAIGMLISIMSSLVGSSLSGARIPFAAARDRLFFPGIARVYPRFHTPAVSLAVQAALASVLVLALGRFQRLFSLAIFAEWITYGFAASTVFVFRRRDRAAGIHRPFSVPLFPMVPMIFLVAAGVVTAFSVADKPADSLLGAALIALGVPVYLWFARQRTANPAVNMPA